MKVLKTIYKVSRQMMDIWTERGVRDIETIIRRGLITEMVKEIEKNSILEIEKIEDWKSPVPEIRYETEVNILSKNDFEALKKLIIDNKQRIGEKDYAAIVDILTHKD